MVSTPFCHPFHHRAEFNITVFIYHGYPTGDTHMIKGLPRVQTGVHFHTYVYSKVPSPAYGKYRQMPSQKKCKEMLSKKKMYKWEKKRGK